MNYEKMSIEQLENLCAELYQKETQAHKERAEATKVLRLKLKKREKGEKIEEAKAALAELAGPSWFDRLKERVGL